MQPERARLYGYGNGGQGSQESRIWRHFLAYDYAYEGAVRVASGNGLPRQQGS